MDRWIALVLWVGLMMLNDGGPETVGICSRSRNAMSQLGRFSWGGVLCMLPWATGIGCDLMWWSNRLVSGAPIWVKEIIGHSYDDQFDGDVPEFDRFGVKVDKCRNVECVNV